MDDLTLDLTYHATCRRRDEAGGRGRALRIPVFPSFRRRTGRKGRRYDAGSTTMPPAGGCPARAAAVYAPAKELPQVRT